MPDNSTWAGMIALNLTVHVYCSHCERDAKIDLAMMPADEKAIGRTFRCVSCDRPASPIVSHQSANYSYPGAKVRIRASSRDRAMEWRQANGKTYDLRIDGDVVASTSYV